MALNKDQLESLTVGQRLFVVGRTASEEVVTKIGRQYFYTSAKGREKKWAKDSGKFQGETFGYGYHLWFSRGHYDLHIEKNNKVRRIAQLAQSMDMDRLSIHELDQIIKLMEVANG